MADCNTCSQYMSVEDILRRSIKCDANGNVATQGGLLNGLPDWAKTPYFALPTDGVSLLVGQEVTIYGDELVNIPIDNNLTVEYTCDIGTITGNNITFNPDTVGVYPITMVFKEGNRIFETKTINLSVIPKASAGSKKIMMVGDSLVAGGSQYIGAKINSILNNSVFDFIGTNGTTILNEGYSGTSWFDFLHNPGVKFVKNFALNIPAYFADNSIDTPDIIHIRLGVNDCFAQSTIAGDKLTDAEVAAKIADAKTFIDGFLNFNSAIKILIGLQTVSENTGVAWNDNYDESLYSQDIYIENCNKLRQAFVSVFANCQYNNRVDCSYESILLDRTNGYPALNSIHPTQAGYEQLAIGISAIINKLLITPVLSVSWVNDYASLTWNNNLGAAAVFEVYESKNGGDYTLVTTTAAGAVSYNNYTQQNASMNFKIRAKIGEWYSDYSDVVNYVTPLVFKTNQSVLTPLLFNRIKVAAGKTINVDYGDGTNADFTGVTLNTSKSYSVAANPYYVKISGDVDSIIHFYHDLQIKSYGSLTKWNYPANAIILSMLGCSFTGELGLNPLPVGIVTLDISSNNTQYTGNLNNWILSENATYINLRYHNFTGLPRGSFKGLASSASGLMAENNDCSTAEIDSFLVALNTYFTSNTPIKSSRWLLNGAGMGIPSVTGLAARQGVIDKYVAAGFVATITVNA